MVYIFRRMVVLFTFAFSPEVLPELLRRGPLLLVPRLARHALLGRRGHEGPAPPPPLAFRGVVFVVVILVCKNAIENAQPEQRLVIPFYMSFNYTLHRISSACGSGLGWIRFHLHPPVCTVAGK